MIPFNRPPHTGAEDQYVSAPYAAQAVGCDHYTLRCHQWFREQLGSPRPCSRPHQALEMAALLIDLQPGDEVIMPSFTFVSTANAFVLRGARVVFVDIRPDTMNIDETLIEEAIPRTKAIVVVHYAGIACEMDTILDVGRRHHWCHRRRRPGMMAHYKGRPLGTLGDLGTFSFHETKNYTSGGEGGLLIINDDRHLQRAEIIREKGTNRSQFFRGMVDNIAGSIWAAAICLRNQAAYLWGQLTVAGEINQNRLRSWNAYHQAFADLEAKSRLVRPTVPPACRTTPICTTSRHTIWMSGAHCSTTSNTLESWQSSTTYRCIRPPPGSGSVASTAPTATPHAKANVSCVCRYGMALKMQRAIRSYRPS